MLLPACTAKRAESGGEWEEWTGEADVIQVAPHGGVSRRGGGGGELERSARACLRASRCALKRRRAALKRAQFRACQLPLYAASTYILYTRISRRYAASYSELELGKHARESEVRRPRTLAAVLPRRRRAAGLLPKTRLC